MLTYLTLILFCQLVGEIISQAFALPIPGPVIGMAILFLGLLIKGRTPSALESVANLLLQVLSLLFVPAGVGIIVYLDLLKKSWAAIAGAVVVGTLLAIAITGLVMQMVVRKKSTESF